ncbi:hypothetical protein M9Y10_016663 [Tritrichomonas musculus]|uniref:RING-type domain-containing protein n=1 Tax=Tritrichomonas musculus TaxID=1915356 RepID=A0ABR2HYC0_9EUKA
MTNGPFYAFSSPVEYKKILTQKILLLNQYNEQFFDRCQIMSYFLRENQIFNWIKYEILPQFPEKYKRNDFNTNLLQMLLEYARNKIFTYLDEDSSLYFNKARGLFLFLSNYVKYSSFVRNPPNISKYLPYFLKIRSILYSKFPSTNVFTDFLPDCSAQFYIELLYKWIDSSAHMKQLLLDETTLILQKDEKKAFFSSLGPDLFASDQDFKDLINKDKELFNQNHSLTEILPSHLNVVNELLMNLKNDVKYLQKIFLNYQDLLIQTIPFDSAIKFLNNENYYLFIRPPGIKIDQNIFNSTFYFEKTINEIKDQIDSLKKNLDQRRQFEQYLRCKYNLTNDNTNFQKDTYQSFESILCLFNQIIENIDVFDDCNFTIHNLSSFFADKKAYNNELSNFLGICNLDHKIEFYKKIINEKLKQISSIEDEIFENLDTMNTIKQNISIINKYKNQIENCKLCITNRNYLLPNCGHTFCDSCYQKFCWLSPEDRKCPFCQTPFTLDNIVKICWTSEKISSDDDYDDDD